MKILFLVSRFPYPLEKGDKLRAYQHIMNMAQSGHEVHLVALSDKKVSLADENQLKKFCTSINIIRLHLFQLFWNLAVSFIRNLPLQIGYFYSRGNRIQIEKIIDDIKPDLIYCQLIRTVLFVSNVKDIPMIIDYQDAFSRGTSQRISGAPFILKPLFKREYSLVKKFEEQSYNLFSAHFIISKQDRDAIHIGAEKFISILPNGIDSNFFKPVEKTKQYHITFVGNMNYPPNVDGSLFLVNEVMPLVWKVRSEVTVQLGGANPNARVKALAGKNVTVTGWMDDIRKCYSETEIFIAPMRIGTGLQNKLLEAMAMQIPSITTPISFEPLGAESGKDILVGKDASELASLILKLLSDAEYRNEISVNGYQFVIKNYSMNHSREKLNDVIMQVTKK